VRAIDGAARAADEIEAVLSPVAAGDESAR
jgi:hypothetical protein